MAYNAQTDGHRISNDANYPSDALVTTGFHTHVTEMISLGIMTATQSLTDPGALGANAIWYKPDSGLAGATTAAGDSALYRRDAGNTTWNAMTPTEWSTYIQNLYTAGLDTNALTAETVVDMTADYIILYDATDTANNKMTPQDWWDACMTTMATLAGANAIDPDNDRFAVYDSSGTDTKTVTASEIRKTLPRQVTATTGGNYAFDFNNEYFTEFFLTTNAALTADSLANAPAGAVGIVHVTYGGAHAFALNATTFKAGSLTITGSATAASEDIFAFVVVGTEAKIVSFNAGVQ